RDLREKAAYGPAQSRFKVYIIDEAHMVTPQGFNALLKIVEEPPEHVKFVFATTEPEKVIGTIRSRTHHYPFRLVPPARLQDYLEELCRRENVQVEPGVLSFVVRAGGGSVRDSLSVLDQLIAGSDDAGLTYAGAAALLGFTEGELLDACVDAIAAGDGAGVFRQVDRIIETGQDPRRFVEDLLERFRDLIVIAALTHSADSADDVSLSAVLRGLPVDQITRMRQQAGAFGAGQLSFAADVINAGLTEMTGATSPRLQLELLCARLLLPAGAGEHGYAARIDRLERRLDVGGGMAAPALPAEGHAPGGHRTPAQDRPGPEARSRDDRAEQRPSPDRGHERDTAGADAESTEPQRQDRPGSDRTAQRGAPGRPGGPAASDGPGGPADAGATQQPGSSQSGASQAGRTHPGSSHPAEEAPGTPSAPRPPSGPRGGVDTEMVRRNWPDVLQRIYGIRRVTWTFLSEHAQVLDYDGTRVLLGLSTKGLATTFRNGPHSEVVRQALSEALGVDAKVEGIPADDAPAAFAGRGPGSVPPTADRSARPEPPAPTPPAPGARGGAGEDPAARPAAAPPSSRGGAGQDPHARPASRTQDDAPTRPTTDGQGQAGRERTASSGRSQAGWSDDGPPPSDDDVPPDEESLPPDLGGHRQPRRGDQRDTAPTTPTPPEPVAGAAQSTPPQAEASAGVAGQPEPAQRPARPPRGAAQAREALRSARERASHPHDGDGAARGRVTHDDEVSVDDEDIADAGAVGQPVIADVLGGVVIAEEDS
ncbi:MAG: DNA polymerase III subunit gamma and tau, partial [Mobilicoccus sp.]|nr:DNA polymerase III subunit gamma and tau [Mobilicoccus sp.]